MDEAVAEGGADIVRTLGAGKTDGCAPAWMRFLVSSRKLAEVERLLGAGKDDGDMEEMAPSATENQADITAWLRKHSSLGGG